MYCLKGRVVVPEIHEPHLELPLYFLEVILESLCFYSQKKGYRRIHFIDVKTEDQGCHRSKLGHPDSKDGFPAWAACEGRRRPVNTPCDFMQKFESMFISLRGLATAPISSSKGPIIIRSLETFEVPL